MSDNDEVDVPDHVEPAPDIISDAVMTIFALSVSAALLVFAVIVLIAANRMPAGL